MSATFTQFKARVAGYMCRDADTFVVGSEDVLSVAVNNAKRWAERKHNFELARTSAVFLSLSLTDGALLSAAKDYYTQANAILIKLIERAYVDASVAGVQRNIPVYSRAYEIMRGRRRAGDLPFVAEELSPTQRDTMASFSLVQHGQRVYLTSGAQNYFGSGTTTAKVYCDIVQWMPLYSTGSDTDFFLEYCEDFMLFRTIFELNLFLKEDQRVAVSDKLLLETWESVLAWDNSIVVGTAEDGDLT
jgi:hypothetical protein